MADCQPSPAQVKVMRLLEAERDIAQKLLSDKVFGLYFTSRNPQSEEARIADAIDMVGNLGGYIAGLETPTWKQLAMAREELSNGLANLEKGGIHAMHRGFFLPKTVLNKFKFLGDFYGGWIRAGAAKRHVTKLSTEILKSTYDTFGAILGYDNKPFASFMKDSPVNAIHRHQQLLGKNTETESAYADIEWEVWSEGQPKPETGARAELKLLPKGEKSPIRLIYDAGDHERGLAAWGERYKRYSGLRAEAAEQIRQIKAVESAGGDKSVRLDVMLSKAVEGRQNIRDMIRKGGESKKAAYAILGIGISDVKDIKAGASVVFIAADESMHTGRVYRQHGDLFDIEYRTESGDVKRERDVEAGVVDVIAKASENVIVEGALKKQLEFDRVQIFNAVEEEFGTYARGKMEKLVTEIDRYHANMVPYLHKSWEYHRQYMATKLKNLGVAELSVATYMKKYHPEALTDVMASGFLHRVRLGPAYNAFMQAKARKAKLMLGDITQELSVFETLVDKWEKGIDTHGMSFLDYADKFHSKWSLISEGPHLGRRSNVASERTMSEYEIPMFSWRTLPSATRRLESYGASMQSMAYLTRMNYAYESILENVRKLREGFEYEKDLPFLDKETGAKTAAYVRTLSAIKDFMNKHRNDVMYMQIDEKQDRRRKWVNFITAMEAFSKIGFNLKTITQNSTQAAMFAMKYGMASLSSARQFMESEEGKRILHKEALDWDPSTAPYLLHREDQLFQHLGGLPPNGWADKLLRATDVLIDKSKALHMLAASEMSLHKLAFSAAYNQARVHVGENKGVRDTFENLPEIVENMTDERRFKFLERLGVAKAELDNWYDTVGGAPGSMEEAEHRWKLKYREFVEQKSVDLAHDVRVLVNGDYSTAGRPEMFRTNWGRLVFQFRLFDIIYSTYLGQGFKEVRRRVANTARTRAEIKEEEARIGKRLSDQEIEEFYERAGLRGGEQVMFGFEMSPEAAWSTRLAVAIPLLGLASGVANVDFGGWFEPQMVSFAKGMADFFSDDDEKSNFAFYGRAPIGQIGGPVFSDLMDILHWTAFRHIQDDSKVQQFFFGSKAFRDLEWNKKEKAMLSKFNASLSRGVFRTLPMIMQGRPELAVKDLMFTPDYEGLKEIRRIERAKDIDEIADALFRASNPLR